MHFATLLPAVLAGVAHAHFANVLPPMNFNEATSTQMPCGGFSIMNHTVMSNYSVGGSPFMLTSVDDSLDATISFAMYDNTTNLIPTFRFLMKGQGDLCLPSVKVPAAFSKMVGMEAVVQIKGKTDDGVLSQCAFLQLVAPSTTQTLPAGCKNSTGVTATVAPLGKTY